MDSHSPDLARRVVHGVDQSGPCRYHGKSGDLRGVSADLVGRGQVRAAPVWR
ncbi:hypothetical protein [Pannonibacter sp. SL95]|uniref:hypothetical protein n=1 Tax=Pannonibacter sp. SL95 TaxID=2995153 RepID=UPI002272EA2A|nr:hypothetical protein [Pannonibacter sp. SL95]MCY1707316.1 hypothetical protein [Pannonibacter sp. SL95]